MLLIIPFFFSFFMFVKLRSMLDQRPTCLTGLCEDLDKDSPKVEEQDLSFEVKEANNNTIDSEKSFNAESDDPFHGYCTLCQTTRKVLVAFRDNMTKLMFGLLFVQASLIALFLQAQAKLFLKKELLDFIDLWSMYILFMIEIFINIGVLWARYTQYKGTCTAKGAL